MAATRLSRYAFAPVEVDACGRKYLDVPDPISRKQRADDTRHIVGNGDTLESYAWRAYKSMLNPAQRIRPTAFFWVIAQMNGLVDITQPLSSGSRIRVPSVQALSGEILSPPQFFTRNTTVTS